ncbi:MAG: ribokinase [Oscillospiraceae bacterium]|nr:ribokinase [Oscillospiraceae bacterium]
MRKILNIGSINIDYVYTVPHFIREGETLLTSSREIFHGGKGLNQSIALARAGANIYHASMIGDDGESLLETLQSAGVNTEQVRKGTSPTGHTVIQIDPSGLNCILLFPGANRDLDEKFVDNALSDFSKEDTLVLQNEVSAITYAIKKAKEKGMKVAFTPSPFGEEILRYPLDLVDWWLLNETEGKGLTGEDSPSEILGAMGRKYGGATIALTLGEQGVMCLHGGKLFNQKAYKVNAVDTTAAGDTFAGYFISAVTVGTDIEKALQTASLAAALSVTKKGAADSIPRMEEVEKLLAEFEGM